MFADWGLTAEKRTWPGRRSSTCPARPVAGVTLASGEVRIIDDFTAQVGDAIATEKMTG